MENGNWLDLTKKRIFKQLYKNRKLRSLNKYRGMSRTSKEMIISGEFWEYLEKN